MTDTPRYLLLEGNDPVGPAIMAVSGGTCPAVYGFSGKPAYDRFVENCDRELRPFPLMKGYLQKQVAADGDRLQLIVLDADGPGQLNITAVRMNSALAAQAVNAVHMDADYQLDFDPESNTYRFAENSA